MDEEVNYKKQFWSNKEITSHVFSFQDIISGKNYTIPEFQRMYDWEEEEIDKLFEDIKKSIEDDHYWFISHFLISEIPKEKHTFNLVDGQQRFTTIFLFLIHLKNTLKKMNFDFEFIVRELEGLLKEQATDELKLRLNIPRGEKVLRNIYNGNVDENIERNRFEEKLINNSNIIKKKVENYINELDNNGIRKFYEYLCNLKLSLIKLGENDSETLIFESLNSKGKTLTFIDLINNYFYSQNKKNEDFVFDKKKFSDLMEFLINKKNEKFKWKIKLYKKSSFLNNFIDIYISNLVDLNKEISRYKKMNDIEKFNYFIRNKKEKNNVNYDYEYMLKIRELYIYFSKKMKDLWSISEIDSKYYYLSKLSFILTIKEALPLFFYLIINSKECKFDTNLHLQKINNIEKIVNFFEQLILTIHIVNPSKWFILKAKIHHFIPKEKKIADMNFDDIISQMKKSEFFKFLKFSNNDIKHNLKSVDFYKKFESIKIYLFLELENELRRLSSKREKLKNYMYKLYVDYKNNLKIKDKTKIDYIFSIDHIYPISKWNDEWLADLNVKKNFLGNLTFAVNDNYKNKVGLAKKQEYEKSDILMQQKIASLIFPKYEYSDESKEEYKEFFNNVFESNFESINKKLLKFKFDDSSDN